MLFKVCLVLLVAVALTEAKAGKKNNKNVNPKTRYYKRQSQLSFKLVSHLQQFGGSFLNFFAVERVSLFTKFYIHGVLFSRSFIFVDLRLSLFTIGIDI